MRTYKNFTDAYIDLLEEVYNRPEWECAPRGMKIRESLGVQFKIKNPRDRIPYVKDRKFSISYMVAELIWYLTGNDQTEWIAEYSKFWRNISDDGQTANSAYGARIFKPHPRIAQPIQPNWTQWQYLVDELTADEDSRRAVIHIRVPQDSVLARLDVPCTMTLQFFLRDDKVHQYVTMRSSDLILGLAYDVPFFTVLQELLALTLTEKLGRSIGLGDYVHTSNSLHIYERHFDMLDKILANGEWKGPEMPEMPYSDVSDSLMRLTMYEAQLRLAREPQQLVALWGGKGNVLGDNMHPYWRDWADVLTFHWANKLGEKKLAREFLDGVRFKGYTFFKK